MPDNLEWINLTDGQGSVRYARLSKNHHALEAGDNVVFVMTKELARVPMVRALIEACKPRTDDYFGAMALEDVGRAGDAADLRKRIAARRAALAPWEANNAT